ncbi:MAG: leucyl/phenylalanyl-tRNA--protein transferase [Bacteroidales bacterium]|nr:leucyl/phenylalanyl-tRNA--protein transferase [Bacteroidales bacterium]
MFELFEFPDPNKANDDGLVAIGGDLTPGYLLSAYAQGVFPWFSDGDPIMWWSPNPRMLLKPADFRLSKSLRLLIQKNIFEVKYDTNFEAVIENCAQKPRKGQDGTWITGEMKEAYLELHRLGYVHSVETYHEGDLVGGLYGVSLGKAFFGESMFFKKSNASKVAFYHLVQIAQKLGFHFIDAQQSTSHLASLGAINVDRKDFLNMVNTALQYKSYKGNWGDFNKE